MAILLFSLIVLKVALAVECIICHEEITPNDDISTLPCQHEFHTDCIENWVAHNPSCPLCRTPYISELAWRRECRRKILRYGLKACALIIPVTVMTVTEDRDSGPIPYAVASSISVAVIDCILDRSCSSLFEHSALHRVISNQNNHN